LKNIYDPTKINHKGYDIPFQSPQGAFSRTIIFLNYDVMQDTFYDDTNAFYDAFYDVSSILEAVWVDNSRF
jgi:hypothetical protein